MLVRFFKPSWQHSKSDKRIKAIAKLRDTDPQSQPILSQLALEDQDELVRLAAIEKLNSLSLLTKISKQTTSDTIQQQSLHRISQLILGSSPECVLDEKLVALKTIGECNFLTHIVLNSSNEQIRQQAIQQLDDDYSLFVIAEKSQRAADRSQAAQRINCPETLDKICKVSRNKDKGVFKAARDKLQAIEEQEAEKRQTQDSITLLISKIEQLSEQAFFPLFAAKLCALVSDWEALSSHVNSDQRARFQQYQQQCEHILSAEEARLQQQQAEEALKQEKVVQSHHLYSELCVLKESTEAILDQNRVNEVESQLQAISEQWETLKAFSSEQEQQSFNKIKSQLGNLLACYRIYIAASEQIDNLTHTLADDNIKPTTLNKQMKQARQLLNKLSWPTHHEKPTPLVHLETVLATAQAKIDRQDHQQSQLHDELKTLLDNLTESIQQGEIRNADKYIKKVEQINKRLNGNLPPALAHRVKILGAELQEMRDWQAYAVQPKKENLCQEMEALSASDLTVQERANEVRRIQKEWKLLDATDSVHSQQLWKRFKKASDSAYAPCDQHFSEQKELRIANLKQRELICERLEQLSIPEGSGAEEWKQYEEQIRQAKQDWRTYSPVDRAPGKKLQAKLDLILAQCEDTLKTYRADNIARKQSLIDETTRLLNSDNFAEATDTVKALQQQWKTIGPTPRNQERKLWNQFRENCSQIFEAFYEGKQPNSASNSIQPLLDNACQQLKDMMSSGCSLKALEASIDQAQSYMTELESQNSLVPAFNQDTVQTAIEAQQQLQEQLQSFETEPYLALARKAHICEQLEHAILDQCVTEQLPSIQLAWAQEITTEHPMQNEIAERFATLLKIAETPNALESILSEQEQKLRQICIRLEIASSQPSPLSDQALRMEYQMERLQQALAEQKQAFNLAEIKQLEHEWLCIPFAAHIEEFNDRFESKLEQIF